MLHPMPKGTQAHGFQFYQRAQAGGRRRRGGRGERQSQRVFVQGEAERECERQRRRVSLLAVQWGRGAGVVACSCALRAHRRCCPPKRRAGGMDGKCANKMHRVSCVVWRVRV